ncbi:MFS transporter [Pseudonocardia sp. TRM90224]|uniref:MFS transporter n=1 Tax=Pseudonocardia sp. TRM90224 TaxID=2812678 RepID=UPI001E478AAF|nr:MFS transporter [Pseudonocardia sp. TRM90224]
MVLQGLLDPLRRRDFRLLVGGQTLSTFGDLLFLVAFPFLVLDSGAGIGGLGLTLALLGIARLAATPLGGILADRVHPRVTMLVADGGRAIVLGGLAVWTAAGPVPWWAFTLVGVVLGGFEGLFLPAYRAITPAVLPSGQLQAGNSVGEVSNIVAAICGQLAAGLLLATYGATVVIVLNVVSFALSAASLLAMSGRVPGIAPAADPSHQLDQLDQLDQLGVGEPAPASFWAFVRGSRLFHVIIGMAAMVTVTASGVFAFGLPVLAHERFPDGALIFGYLLAAGAVGRLGGSVAAGGLIGLHRRGLLSIGLLVVHGVIIMSLPAIHGFWLLLVLIALLGFADGTLGVLVVTLLQQLPPREILGRVMAVFAFVHSGSYPISVALAAFATAQWGIAAAFTAGGIGVLVVAVIGLAQRAVRDA